LNPKEAGTNAQTSFISSGFWLARIGYPNILALTTKSDFFGRLPHRGGRQKCKKQVLSGILQTALMVGADNKISFNTQYSAGEFFIRLNF
jgi:hypothetical protein